MFNEFFSSARVIIEHVNGILKGRFSSLRGIRTQIKTEKDFKIVNTHVLVCLILHNLLMDFGNDECEEEWMEEEDDSDDEEEIITPLQVDAVSGQDKRVEVQNILLDWVLNKNNV